MQTRRVAIVTVVLFGVMLGIPDSEASIVEESKAIQFLKKQQCDVWFADDLAPQLPGYVPNEISCLFYGTIHSGSMDEQKGCLWARLDLDTGETQAAGAIPLIVQGEKCTAKAIAKLFLPSLTVPGGFNCENGSAKGRIFGGKRALLPFLKKTFAACSTVVESQAKTQTRSQEPQQKPSGNTPRAKSFGSASEDTPSPRALAQEPSGIAPSTRHSAVNSGDTPLPLAAIAEGVTTAVGQAIQVWSTVPISWSARSSAANDAEQAADKAIRQLKALPKEQGTQTQRKAFTRSFGTFAKAMRVLSEGAAAQDVEALQSATTMVLQAAKEIKQTP